MLHLQKMLSSVINLFSVSDKNDGEEIVLRSWGEIGLAVFIVFFIVGMNVVAG